MKFFNPKANNLPHRNIEFIGLRCVGCRLCEVSCSFQAITVTEIEGIGFKPLVDEDKCSRCGLCIELCPLSRLSYPADLSRVKEVFHSFSRVPNIYFYGASGGIVTTILYYLFDREFIDAAYVAFYDDKMNIYGDIITSKEEVLKHSGSYYQHPKYMINIKKIAKYHSVAFVGLPCHIEALRSFAKRFDISNIYVTISLFCTIGRMRAGLRDFLKSKYNLKLEDLRVLKYMSRYGTKRLRNISIKLKNGSSINYSCIDYLDYVDYFYTPLGCFNCRRMFGLSADISVGDDWGIRTDRKIALVIANTEKGLALLNELQRTGYLYLKPIDASEAITHLLNSQPNGTAIKVFRSPETMFQLIILKFIGLICRKLRAPYLIPNTLRGLTLLYIQRRALKEKKKVARVNA